MKKLIAFLSSTVYLFLTHNSNAQQTSDTASHRLEGVIIKAYEGNRKLKEVPAGVNYISSAQLNRFDNGNILSAVNTTPGARMEERSPGSYRLNMRGSSLRSPFGVRNVKIYWNDIPFTDPGGNTYLNQLNVYDFQTIEIIKGPSGSLYGAGNGGAMLINQSPVIKQDGLDINLTAGGFNMKGLNVQLHGGNDKLKNAFAISRTQKDGYREHTEMERTTATWQMQLKTSAKNKLVFNFLYGDLFYQTPGGLTRTEYNANPKSARPAAGIFPSAETAKAAIYQKMFLGGITNYFQISSQFSNTTSVYAMQVDLKNPTFRNYEKRDEPSFGGRTVFKWELNPSKVKTVFVFGAEAQKGNFNIRTSANNNGEPGTLLTDDDVKNRNLLLFAQSDFSFEHDLNITVGASLSSFEVGIKRLNVANPIEQSRTYSNEISPRLAISKRIIKDLWLYGSVAKGFSPPTVAEVLPSNSVISTTLNAEHGINYETGIKSTWFQQKIYAEVNLFYYKLKDAIVQRRDASNADYFENAGSTTQKGLEWQVQYFIIRNDFKKLNNLSLRITHSLHDFRYKEFKQLTTDFSKKALPGVPKNTFAALLDISLKAGVYMHATYYYGDKVALNDANTEYATSYNLVASKIGWKTHRQNKSNFDFFAGVDNLFDVTYSLGNDVNAAGGRFFNTASGRNFYGGVSVNLAKKKK
jgi:iron complex outermembrane receptor protein